MKKNMIALMTAVVLSLTPICQVQAAVFLLPIIVIKIIATTAVKTVPAAAGKMAASAASKTVGHAATAAAKVTASGGSKALIAGKGVALAGSTGAGAGAIASNSSAIDWKSAVSNASYVTTAISTVKEAYDLIKARKLEELPHAPIRPALEAAAQSNAQFPIRTCTNPVDGKPFVVSPEWHVCPDNSRPQQLGYFQF
ncbi:MAG: hypothetical protein ACXWT1_04090 [Methylobacter sp.]